MDPITVRVVARSDCNCFIAVHREGFWVVRTHRGTIRLADALMGAFHNRTAELQVYHLDSFQSATVTVLDSNLTLHAAVERLLSTDRPTAIYAGQRPVPADAPNAIAEIKRQILGC